MGQLLQLFEGEGIEFGPLDWAVWFRTRLPSERRVRAFRIGMVAGVNGEACPEDLQIDLAALWRGYRCGVRLSGQRIVTAVAPRRRWF